MNNHERTDLKQLAKEFGVVKIGRYGIKFLPKDPTGKPYRVIQIIPLIDAD